MFIECVIYSTYTGTRQKASRLPFKTRTERISVTHRYEQEGRHLFGFYFCLTQEHILPCGCKPSMCLLKREIWREGERESEDKKRATLLPSFYVTPLSLPLSLHVPRHCKRRDGFEEEREEIGRAHV